MDRCGNPPWVCIQIPAGDVFQFSSPCRDKFGIIEDALVVLGLADRPVCRDAAPGRERLRVPLMKTLRLVSTPTRNRRLNEIIGLTVVVAAGLLLLALASY